tara:strand:+ start:338 stop:562 length:225 start_codon:yes stop_codon:yes gene_type:complete
MSIKYTHKYTSNQEAPRFHVDRADDDVGIINVKEFGKVAIILTEDEMTVAVYKPHAIGGEDSVKDLTIKKSELV